MQPAELTQRRRVGLPRKLGSPNIPAFGEVNPRLSRVRINRVRRLLEPVFSETNDLRIGCCEQLKNDAHVIWICVTREVHVMRIANYGLDQWRIAIIDGLLQHVFIKETRWVFTLRMRRSDDDKL